MEAAEKIYQMATSPNWVTRMKAASKGYNLDKLLTDEDWSVRVCVAIQNFGLDVLITDKTPNVRKVVAEQGYGLDVLVKDESKMVRKAARKAAKKYCNQTPNPFGALKPKSRKPKWFGKAPAYIEKDLPCEREYFTRAVKLTYSNGDVVYLAIKTPKMPTHSAFEHIENFIKSNQPSDVKWE